MAARQHITDAMLETKSLAWLVDRGFRTKHEQQSALSGPSNPPKLQTSKEKRRKALTPFVHDFKPDPDAPRRWQEHAERMAMLAAEEAALKRVTEWSERARASLAALKRERHMGIGGELE